jgi:transcriptional regulator with XRE-family HTH domain
METTITSLAKKMGISQGYLSNILAGRRRPHYQKAKHIAKITNTSVFLWMEGSPEDMQAALYSIKEVA